MKNQNYGELHLPQLVELSFTDNDAKEYLISSYHKHPVVLAQEIFVKIEENTKISKENKKELMLKIACLRDIADSIDLEDIANNGSFKAAEIVITERLKRANLALSF